MLAKILSNLAKSACQDRKSLSLYEELSSGMPGLNFLGIVELVADADAVFRNGVWIADLTAFLFAAVSPRNLAHFSLNVVCFSGQVKQN